MENGERPLPKGYVVVKIAMLDVLELVPNAVQRMEIVTLLPTLPPVPV
jgi:hypothetical protein